MAQSGYGSYKYESPEARALGTITSESYDKDQAKNLIKLNNDVSYMAAYMRKMQKGIDDANQNVIQQIQSFINDIVVLIGGGSAQGFDFGDLRYILQMIGALLGIGEQDFPLSAFESAWHMLSTYIFPSAQFEDVINALIDSAIGGILDLFGEVPIAGEALQQLAAVILSVRDFFSSFDLSHLVISISQLADQSPTVIWEGGFDTATTIPEGFGFAWDASGETSPFGSAVAVGDGTEKAIFSNIFEVGKKQVFDFRTAVWFSNASNSGSDAVVIELVPYDENNVVGTPVKIAGISPSANSSGWVTLQGNYTIPNSGWSKAVARIRVTNKLTAGTIKFDNAIVTRTQKILQEWVSGLAQALGDIVDWIENLVDELLDAIGLGGGVGGLFDKIQDLATGIGEWLLDTEDVSAGLANLFDWKVVQDQINDLLDGDLFLTPINSYVQSIKDKLVLQAGKLQNLTINGFLPGTSVQTGLSGALNLENAVQQAINAVIEGAGGLLGSGGGGAFSFLDMVGQLTGLRQGVQGNAEQLAALQVSVAGMDPAASSEVVNLSEFVDSATPPSMFTKVNDLGSGFIKTAGGKLVWDGSTGREFYLFNGGPLQTDLFEVKIVLPKVPSHGWFGDDSSNFLYLIGRSDAAGNNMTMLRVGWDEARVYSYNSGVFTQIGSGYGKADLLTGGCSVGFKGGTLAEPRYFKASVNEQTVYEVTDDDPISLYGASYRYCGLGIEKGSSYDTGTISSWSMLDGGASAGSGVVTGYSASGLTNLGLWEGTLAHYNAIVSKSPTTVYVIKG